MRCISAVLAALMVATLCVAAQAQIEVKTDSDSGPDFSSSITCAKCHRDIYNYWKESLHAHALDDHIFQAAFMMAIKDEGDKARALCLACHAPTTTMTGDTMTELDISKEAVTCDFCHRISEVEMGEDAATVTLTSGDEKYGPLEAMDDMEEKKGHPSVRSDLFTDSKLCATCHQWTNEHGVAIFDTYREWLNGPFAKKGVHCQDCHMPLVEGSVVAGRRGDPAGRINSHNLSGGHSIVQVVSAATVSIKSVERVLGGIQAVVEVSNVGSGHMIPTGIPSRSLELEVQLLDGGGKVVETAKHLFRKVIVDEDHNELTSDADLILKGAAISKDNRIPPGETVEVPFHFAASSKNRYLVRATLSYKYAPLILKEEDITIEMGSDVKSP